MNKLFSAGFSKVCITPPIGTPMSGFSSRCGPSIGIHDPLYARVLYLLEGNEEWMLISLDVAGIDAKFSKGISKEIRKKIGIKEDKVIITATHTHSGPDIRFYFSDPDPFLHEYIKRHVIGAALVAYLDKDTGKVGIRKSIIKDVSINRRRPGEGLIDPDFYTILIKRNSKKSIALISFACHPTILGPSNRYLSADYPGVLNKMVEKLGNLHSMFFNGACGDINPLTPTTTIDDRYKRGVGSFEEVEWLGKILAYEAIKNILLIKNFNLSLKGLTSHIEVETLLPSSVENEKIKLEELKSKLRKASDAGNTQEEERIRFELWKARRIIRMYEIHGASRLKLKISILAFNKEIAMVFLPGEILVELGLKIKFYSPFKDTIVIGYSNDYIGYVAPSSAYRLEGYETMFPASILKPGEGDKIVRVVLELLDKIYE
ncbi:MAG: hypothetical protein DRJ64_04155 [Thermoprotei archaeon]|nr:MAG: hypothetical protein DRJ64_04155 [Thermoprotei archaeon]